MWAFDKESIDWKRFRVIGLHPGRAWKLFDRQETGHERFSADSLAKADIFSASCSRSAGCSARKNVHQAMLSKLC